ncbi:MAG: phosphodiesterase, partial [Deltaproteobacteria bacterium]|nr:phosphodiesterase [Deltaproteobacteria bacterium]
MPAPYTLISLGVWGLVVATAAVVRGRLYATFVAVILGLHTGISATLEPHLPGPAALHAALQLAVAVHFLALVRPALRPLPYRALVSVPASYWVAGTLLG